VCLSGYFCIYQNKPDKHSKVNHIYVYTLFEGFIKISNEMIIVFCEVRKKQMKKKDRLILIYFER
jgi:hypothetical protein